MKGFLDGDMLQILHIIISGNASEAFYMRAVRPRLVFLPIGVAAIMHASSGRRRSYMK